MNSETKKKDIGIISICIAVIVALILLLPGCDSGSDVDYPQGVEVKLAEPLQPVAANMSAEEFFDSDEHWQWLEKYDESVSSSIDANKNIRGYYSAMMGDLLVAEDDNTVCSPLNTYIAFAMLAEVSGGNTQKQILDMLGAKDIDDLREDVSALWTSNDVDTPILKSLPANSVWLNDSYGYNDETLDVLAQQYHTSSFIGKPGSAEMDEALQKWTDANTGGLLSEYTKDMNLDPRTVLTLVSTIYYKAMWSDVFYPEGTSKQTFHGTKGDTSVDMMHKTDNMCYYRTAGFSAIGLDLTDSGSMFFFLPNEGVDVNKLASDPEVMKVAWNEMDESSYSYPEVNMAIPKFKVSCKTDLNEAMKAMGITDAFDPSASDFTPLTSDSDEIYVSKAEHAAMVEIDENGVTGAAYTEIAMTSGAAMPEEVVDFVLDRPFMFVVTGRDGSVLFAGIVRNVEQ